MKRLRSSSVILALKWSKTMSEWKEYRVGDVCTIVGRIGFRGYTTDDLTSDPNEGAITLSPTNIVQGEIELSKPTYIKWAKYYESPEIMLSPGDIVLVKTGSSIGRTAYIRKITHPMTLNPQFVVFKNIKINSVFLSYIIKSPYFQNLLKSITVGSAIPTLSQKNLANLKVYIPDTIYQSRIAAILSALDDKIENNRRVGENLEQQAQALFKSWFVDFEPFKDGDFVESELGMIPKGWRVGLLSEIADIVMGTSPAGTSYNTEGKGDVFYQGRAEFGFRFPQRNMYTTEAKRFADIDSVLVSVRAPVGDINVAEERCCIGRGLASVKSKNQYNSFILYLLQSLKSIFNKYNGEGTVFGSINKKAFEEIKIAISDDATICKFNNITSSFDKQIKRTVKENRCLVELRDTLLPKLLSGELRVPDTDLINEMLEKGIR